MKLQKVTFVLLSAVAVLLSSGAYASILLEPYVGYAIGTQKTTGSKTLNTKGVTYGGRVGYQQMGLMLGADFQGGSLKDDNTPTTDSINTTDIGAFIGYNFPMMVRVYGVYDFSSKAKVKPSAGLADTYSGDGLKLGIGFTTFPLVSINLEYQMATYTKDDYGTLANKMNANSFGLTVSVPFTF